MLEAADDFVAAHTSAYEAIGEAQRKAHAIDHYLVDDETPQQLKDEWAAERREVVRAARSALDSLGARLPRIELLFGIQSNAASWAKMCDVSLTGSYHNVGTLQFEIEKNATKSDDEHRLESQRLRESRKPLGRFSVEARKAVVASPWSALTWKKPRPSDRALILWLLGALAVLALAVIHS